jgi:hypothetical protein
VVLHPGRVVLGVVAMIGREDQGPEGLRRVLLASLAVEEVGLLAKRLWNLVEQPCRKMSGYLERCG